MANASKALNTRAGRKTAKIVGVQEINRRFIGNDLDSDLGGEAESDDNEETTIEGVR